MSARPLIYKYDQAGNLRTWQAEISSCGTKFRTHAGIDGGSIVTSGWTQVHGNNQRPDAVAQCKFQVDALYTHRLARTYHATVEGAKTGAHFFEPMLAQPLERHRLWFLPEFSNGDEGHDPLVYIQPKLDGMRCIMTADGMFTRNGQEIQSAPHIAVAMGSFFAENPDVVLDGEIYSDELAEDFEKIMSLARKTFPTDADLRESARLLQYHVYDMPSLDTDGYKARIEAIDAMICFVADKMPFGGKSPMRKVETIGVYSWAEWDEAHADWVKKKYEGSIGRIPDALYQQKRTFDLIKRKDFIDDEFAVSAMEEGKGNWAGACKRIFCWLPSTPEEQRIPANAKDPKLTFKATPTGSYLKLQEVLQGPLPSEATVEFLGWTRSKISKPRHPSAKMLYWGKRDD